MTLREQYEKLSDDIHNEYQRLINIGDYDLLTENVKEHYEHIAEDFLEEVENNGIDEAVGNWIEVLDLLEQVYYNDRQGDERVAYLLGVEKENGLYVFDDDSFRTMFISFSDLNGLLTKINVIEAIKNS